MAGQDKDSEWDCYCTLLLRICSCNNGGDGGAGGGEGGLNRTKSEAAHGIHPDNSSSRLSARGRKKVSATGVLRRRGRTEVADVTSGGAVQ